jgi:hypothetical protein|tara:strand:+ start:241 stop:708 length:468 start_codon:yes stop_codon:yes gene_type:complete
MSTALSDYLESGLLHHIFRGSSFPKPSEIAIALCSGAPLDSDTGFTIPELPTGINGSGTGYARIDLGDPSTQGDTTWVYSQQDHIHGSGLIKNSGSLVFEKALIDWGFVSGIAITDDSRHGSGNLLMHSELSNPRIIYKGDAVKFDVTNLQIKFN